MHTEHGAAYEQTDCMKFMMKHSVVNKGQRLNAIAITSRIYTLESMKRCGKQFLELSSQ